MSFWENVENIRELRDITRKELAYKADFSINSISTGLARESIPAADVACRIAHELGVSVEFLVYGRSQNDFQNDKSEEKHLSETILDKKGNLIKYMEKYTDLIEDFSAISPDMQKTVGELIHKIAKEKTTL